MAYDWNTKYLYGDVYDYVNDPQWATYGQLQSGDEPAFDPVWDPTTNEAVKALAEPGMTFGTQYDGDMTRSAVFDPSGSVAYGGEPSVYEPFKIIPDALLPLAAFAIGAPLLGSAAGIPIPAGTPTLGGLFGAGESAAGTSTGGSSLLAQQTIPNIAAEAVIPEGLAGMGTLPSFELPALAAAGGATGASLGGSVLAQQAIPNITAEAVIPEGLAGMGTVPPVVLPGTGGLLGTLKDAGTDALSFLKENKWALPLLGAGLGGLGGGSSGGGGYVDSGYRPTIKRGGFAPSAKPSYMQPQQVAPQGLLAPLPKTGVENSGLWRYGPFGG